MTPIRTALIGYGMAGSTFHGPLLAADPAYAVRAIVTHDPQRRAQARAAHPGATLVDAPDALWAHAADLDLVVVAAPNRAHVSLARAALDRGLAVVVDKPLAATAAEGRALAGHARARERLLGAFHNRRWDGDFLTARRLVDDGRLGEVVRWESRFERWRPALKAGAWREREDPADAGGLLYDLGSHLVDQVLVANGPACCVYAELDRHRPGAAVDDDAFVAITHVGGVRSHLWMTNVAAQPAARLRVLGARGSYVKHGLDVQEAALRDGMSPADPSFGVEPEPGWGLLGVSDDGELERVRTERGRYTAYYAELARALRDGMPPPVTAEEAVAVLEVLDAARRSAAEQVTVTLP